MRQTIQPGLISRSSIVADATGWCMITPNTRLNSISRYAAEESMQVEIFSNDKCFSEGMNLALRVSAINSR